MAADIPGPKGLSQIKCPRHRRSQNHSMLGVGRDLCGSSSPTPLPKQGLLQQAVEDCVQAGLEYLQRQRLQNFLGQPVAVLHHPQREEVLPHLQMELPMLQFVPESVNQLTLEGGRIPAPVHSHLVHRDSFLKDSPGHPGLNTHFVIPAAVPRRR